MAAFKAYEQTFVDEAYWLATGRIQNLEDSNAKRASKIRHHAIDELRAHQQQIEQLGFFEKVDFSLAEQTAIFQAADAIVLLDGWLEDAHELTLMELESDLAHVIQRVSLGEQQWALRSHWVSARRYQRLPVKIPQEVSDEFRVGVFTGVQANLNQVAGRVKKVSDLRCLNSDDYSSKPGDLEFNAAMWSAKTATDNYVEFQQLRDVERATRAAEKEDSLSIGGVIWDVIGWDSPTDFLKDVVLTVGTGGVGKVVRWTKNLKKARDRLIRAEKSVEKLADIQQHKKRIQEMENRIQDIGRKAERIRKAEDSYRMAAKVMALFKKIEKAAEQVKLIEKMGKELKLSYIRGVASTITVRTTGIQGVPINIAGAATGEAALLSIKSRLAGTPLSKRIEELRTKINFKTVLRAHPEEHVSMQFTEYFFLVVARETVARLVLAVAHKLTLNYKLVVTACISSFRATIEQVLVDLGVISESSAKAISRTIWSSVAKTVEAFAQDLAKTAMAP